MKIFFLKVSHFELSSAIVTCTVSPIVFAFFFPVVVSRCVFPVVGSALRAGNLNGDPKRGGHGAGEPWLSPGVLQRGDTTGEPQRGK